jgi:hypothetical protein
MESTPKMSRDEFIAHMRTNVEEALGRVADAINEAPPGQIISKGVPEAKIKPVPDVGASGES